MTEAVLCDIEGTIGSIGFVRDTLFVYAAERMPEFVQANRHNSEVREQLDVVATRARLNPFDTDALVDRLLQWIDKDRKETSLKALQGMIWVDGYRSGKLRAHIYEDAGRNLRDWRSRGLTLAIFSSGSVQAQKLYFQYSDQGDLRPLFIGWFDTTTGPKNQAGSYTSIAATLGLPASKILFLSDIEAELNAAASAGMSTTWLIRPEDSDLDIDQVESRHPAVSSFDEIEFPGVTA
jgi:enolase-phosphatase E1